MRMFLELPVECLPATAADWPWPNHVVHFRHSGMEA
jgi:hypothetical protein